MHGFKVTTTAMAVVVTIHEYMVVGVWVTTQDGFKYLGDNMVKVKVYCRDGHSFQTAPVLLAGDLPEAPVQNEKHQSKFWQVVIHTHQSSK